MNGFFVLEGLDAKCKGLKKRSKCEIIDANKRERVLKIALKIHQIDTI